uniref:hypothetical protein n=1 Tax=Flavobacterium sp. TaxID=239 RepID=UPI0040474778
MIFFNKKRFVNNLLLASLLVINILIYNKFNFIDYLILTAIIFFPYTIFLINFYLLPKKIKVGFVTNQRIFNYSIIILLLQVAFKLYLFGLLFLIISFLYLVLLLRSIDSLINNWKTYNYKSKIFNSILLIYNLPILFFGVFLSSKGIPTDNKTVTIEKEKVRFINAKTGKEMDIDSIMKPHVDSIIKEHKNSK